MKKNSTLVKELRKELHYWQTRVRLDIYSLKGSIRKCKEIAAKMRELSQNK